MFAVCYCKVKTWSVIARFLYNFADMSEELNKIDKKFFIIATKWTLLILFSHINHNAYTVSESGLAKISARTGNSKFSDIFLYFVSCGDDGRVNPRIRFALVSDHLLDKFQLHSEKKFFICYILVDEIPCILYGWKIEKLTNSFDWETTSFETYSK